MSVSTRNLAKPNPSFSPLLNQIKTTTSLWTSLLDSLEVDLVELTANDLAGIVLS